MKWWNKPVTWNILVKFMITLNILALAICWRFAYIGDSKDKEEQEYLNYLEERVETQSELIKLYRNYVQELTK